MMWAVAALLVAAAGLGVAAAFVSTTPNGLSLVALLLVAAAVALYARIRSGVPGE